MAQKHHIIYVPGLGDRSDNTRQFALNFWRVWNVETELVPMQWYDGKSYKEKFDRVNNAVDEAKKAGKIVSLVGESAGGSMALNVAARRTDLHRVITVAGVNSPTMHVAPSILKRSPAFQESIDRLVDSLKTVDYSRIETIRGLRDASVAAKYATLVGAANHLIFSFAHLMTTSSCLSIYSFYVVWLIKRV